MERAEALAKLEALKGCDLRLLADKNKITVWKEGKLNKGWAGHALERYLGLPLNSSRSPNFGSWELKLVPLKRDRSGALKVKETMAITMLDPEEVSQKEFEDSHLYLKLRKLVVASRIFSSKEETTSIFYAAVPFDLDNPNTFAQVKADYDQIRNIIKVQGFCSLSGAIGELIQPRTKGAGHGSTSRAFYARPRFVSRILGLT